MIILGDKNYYDIRNAYNKIKNNGETKTSQDLRDSRGTREGYYDQGNILFDECLPQNGGRHQEQVL